MAAKLSFKIIIFLYTCFSISQHSHSYCLVHLFHVLRISHFPALAPCISSSRMVIIFISACWLIFMDQFKFYLLPETFHRTCSWKLFLPCLKCHSTLSLPSLWPYPFPSSIMTTYVYIMIQWVTEFKFVEKKNLLKLYAYFTASSLIHSRWVFKKSVEWIHL